MELGHTKTKGNWFTNNTRQVYSTNDDLYYENQSGKVENGIPAADEMSDYFHKNGRLGHFSDILHKFCDSTSAHGFYQVKLGRERTSKLIWLLVLMIGFSGLGYHLSSLIKKYLNFQYDETTVLVSESPQFPDMTICNMDGISGDRFVLDPFSPYFRVTK